MVFARWFALVLLAGGLCLLASGPEVSRRHVVVAGVPLDEVHPADDTGRRPGVVVAHGFAGSARLMAQFGDTLAARGYVVVLPDLSGHGANGRPLAEEALQRDLDVAMSHLRGLPDVDPARVTMVGHSMGAGAVTRYAAAHPVVAATVAISLPDPADVPPPRLLVLVGAAEFAGFHAAAAGVPTSVVIPGVEHVTILYAPRTHRETVTWLDAAVGAPTPDRSLPSPLRRPAATGLLILAFLLGMRPLARRLTATPPPTPPTPGAAAPGSVPSPGVPAPGSGPSPAAAGPSAAGPSAAGPSAAGPSAAGPSAAGAGPSPVAASSAAAPVGSSPSSAAVVGSGGGPVGELPPVPRRIGRLAVVTVGSAVVAVLLAPLLPTVRLPLASGGFVVGFTTLMGLAILALHRVPDRWTAGRRRQIAGAPVLVGYAAVAVAVPLHLGLTHALPVGPRWWLLLCVWAGFAVLALAAGPDVLLVSAVAVIAMTAAALAGLTSTFLLLVVPLLAALLVWQAAWAAILRRTATPPWLIAMAGSLVVAWPIATTLPLR